MDYGPEQFRGCRVRYPTILEAANCPYRWLIQEFEILKARRMLSDNAIYFSLLLAPVIASVVDRG